MKLPPAKLVLTCTGNVADKDLEERLAKITTALEGLSKSKDNSVNLSKVEPWNSVRVTFNIPKEAAARLRELAQRGDLNLHKLGILTVQVENGETIALPPPPPEAQRSLFSPLPPSLSGTPQLPPGPPLVPPSPTPVSSPLVQASTPTPGMMVPGHGLGASVSGPNFAVPGVSVQQLTRPPLQGLQTSLFSQQGAGNSWNSMGVPQQRPLQPPPSFWNQIPQFFPQVNMTQANQPPQVMPSSPQIPPVSQPKAQPKKRRKRTKKANIQPPDLAVAAGQPLLPLPPHLQSLPTTNTSTQDSTDNFNSNKPSNLTLPPSLIDNPISPSTPPSTSMPANATTTAPVVASSISPGTQFSFNDVSISRGLVQSPQTQQQLLQKKTDVALTSPLLVNLLQSDISAKQFPFSNAPGSKTTSTGTDTLITGQPGPLGQDTLASSAPHINTSSPFMLGNGIGSLTAPNSIIPNMSPFVTSQGNVPCYISTAGQIIQPSTLLQAQSGQLSHEQLQFQLSQLSAAQLSQLQAQHAQSFTGHMPQGPMMPQMPQNQMPQNQIPPNQMPPNQMPLGHMQPIQMPGGHPIPGQPFPGPMPHNQLPNVRMSIGSITAQDPMSQGQIRHGGPMHTGHMPRPPISAEHSRVLANDPSSNLSKGQLHPIGHPYPMGHLHPSTSLVSTCNVPGSPLANRRNTWNTASSSTIKERQEVPIGPRAEKAEQIKVLNAATSQPGPSLEMSIDNSKKPEATKQPEEDGHVFDEEAALLGMTEAERDTMAVAAIIAKEAKLAADAKNGKAQQNKDVCPPKPELQTVNTAATSSTTASFTDGTASVSQQATSSPSAPPTSSFPESLFSPSPSQGGLPVQPVADRRSSNSPVRLSPPKIPENVKQRRTPPSSATRPVHHQQPQYGPIPGSFSSSMSSSIAGLQTLTSRTFSASAQPSIRDMAITRNPEHNTLSQFLSSVTPPTEILQMAPLFRSSKTQDMPSKSAQAFPPGPTAPPNDWLSLPTVDAQKPLPLPAQIGARTPMQPAEFSAATERMLGSMLDTQKPTIINIERPPNHPRVITTEGINFMQKLVGRPPPSNIQNQQPPGDTTALKRDTMDQATSGDQGKREDKSQLKALLNEIVIPEECPFQKQFLPDDLKAEKPQSTLTTTSADSHSPFPPALPHQMDPWLGFNHPAVSVAQDAASKPDNIAQSSNITSIYIPPPVMGQQQQQQKQQQKQEKLHPENQSLPTGQQTAESSGVVTTSSTSVSQRVTMSSGFVAEDNKSQSDSGMKSSFQTSPIFPSHSLGTLSRAVATHRADESMLRFSQQGLPTQTAESLARDSSMARPQRFPPQSFSPHLLVKSPGPHQQPPSLLETPMTVLERAPKILLSPATLSTASEELIKSLGAHGTIASLPPESDAAPEAEPIDAKQDEGSAVEPPAQHLQSLAALKMPVEDACPGTEAYQSMEEKAPVHESTESSIPKLETAMPQTTNQSFEPSSVAIPPSPPATQLNVEQQVQHAVATPEVGTTVAELDAVNVPGIPVTTFESAASTSVTSSSITVQSTSEVLPPMQTSKLLLSQMMGTTSASEQGTESYPEASISTMHPPTLIPQQSTAWTQPSVHDTVTPSGDKGNVLPSLKMPKPIPHSEAVGLKSSDYQTYSFTQPAQETTLKSSQEKSNQLNMEAKSYFDESEADKNTQQMHKKPVGEKHMGQQLKTSPNLGPVTPPPATAVTPIKSTVFASASSTLVQAQSIMVKTAAMSRTSGILKGAEQAARPVRSRTPPRASLSTLPPNTCNNESLGSASALLSSIAKSAWTVTTAMASAAKAKVVPTPKATDKNLTRMRRSPETLPPPGKLAAGERDRGIHEIQTQQSRLPPASTKHTSKTSTAEPSLEASLPSLKCQEGSPPTKCIVRQQPSQLSAPVSMEQAVSSVVPAFHAALATSSAKDQQHTQSCKMESESVSTQSLVYSIISSPPPAPTISSPLITHPQVVRSHSVPGTESAALVRDSSGNTLVSPRLTLHLQKPMPQSPDFHSKVQPFSRTFQAVPSVEETEKPQLVKEVISKNDGNVLSQGESSFSTSHVPQDTGDKPTIQTSSEPATFPTTPPVLIPIVSSHTSIGETSKSSGVEIVPLNSKNSQDRGLPKLTNRPTETTIFTPHPGPTVAATVPQNPLLSTHSNEPAPVVLSDKNTQVPQPLFESRKRMYTGDLAKPPIKFAKTFDPEGVQYIKQSQQKYREANKEISTSTETSDALPILDSSSSKQDTKPKFQPSPATTYVSWLTGQLGQSIDKQEVPSPTETHPVPSEAPEVPRKVDLAQQSERIPESTPRCVSQPITAQGPSKPHRESVIHKSDVSPEQLLLSKPDQITNLVEEAIQMDPEKGSSFEKSSTSYVSEETPGYLSRQQSLELAAKEAVEPTANLPKKTEMIEKNLEKEQSRDEGAKAAREPEGELEPRRTRHTSEEVPGMSTRSLRSGRRSPGEPTYKGRDREKEDSPPATRGRGQKEKEIPGESEADALSRKRSTRSSGREMYYGPIPSYKRRKTNQK